MLVKNVIKGYQNDIEELTIINQEKVIYSGDIEKYLNCDESMKAYKHSIDNDDVINVQTIGGRKLFIFI